MTEEELQQIQAVCREWLRKAGSTNGSRLTIPEGGGLSRSFGLRINGVLTFDNVLILSANDEGTGACYAKLIRQPDGIEEVIDTPFERIPEHLASTSEPTAAATRPTQQRYQETMQKLVEAQQAGANKVVAEPERWWIERDNDDTAVEAKYLLFTNGKLLGHSLLERTGSDGRKSGRFEPSVEYFDHAPIFAAAPQAENDCIEVNVREAYGLPDDGAGEYRNKFQELTDRIEALELYIADASGHKIETSEVRIEDLSSYYDDESERWLHVSFPIEASR